MAVEARSRQLRVTEKPPRERLHHLAARGGRELARAVGLMDGEEPQRPQERDVVIPRKSYRGRKRLRWLFAQGETLSVTKAIEELAASGDQGTKVDFRRFQIHDEKVKDGNIITHRKLRRIGRGWQRGGFFAGSGLGISVGTYHRIRLDSAKRDLHRATKTRGIDKLSGNHTAQVALSSEKRDHRAVARAEAEGKGVISRIEWYKWRSKLIAKALEAKPKKAWKDFEVGQSASETHFKLSNMMLRLADFQLDPEDRIHGPLERGIQLLQRIRSSVAGVAGIRAFDEFLDRINLSAVESTATSVNKLLSRDTRRPLKETIRSFGLSYVYDRYRNKKDKQKGTSILPPRSLVERAQDRRANKRDVVRFEQVERILLTTDLQRRLSDVHQHVVAEQFVRAYRDEPLIEKALHIATSVIEPGIVVGAGAVEKATGLAAKARSGAIVTEELGPLWDAAKGDGTLRERLGRVGAAAKGRARDMVPGAGPKAETGSYADKPSSVKHQVDAILASAPAKIASSTGVDKVRWEIALRYAKRFDVAYRRALELTGQTEAAAPTRRARAQA